MVFGFWIVLLNIFILRLWDVPVCMYVHSLHAWSKGQKRALDALKLKLQMLTLCHVGAGN